MRSIEPDLPLIALSLLALSWIVPLLDWFPNGWDQTGYALVASGPYLPHSPYIAHTLASRLLAGVLSAPLALAWLSTLSALASMALLHGSVRRLAGGDSGRIAGLAAAGVFGGTFLVVRQAATQEVYLFQTAWLLASLFAALGSGARRIEWAGLAFGMAIAVHTSSLLAAFGPLLLLARGERSGRERIGGLFRFAAAAVVPVAVGVAVIGWLLAPARDAAPFPGHLLDYLIGIGPALRPAQWAETGFLTTSLAGVFERLVDPAISTSRLPLATSPTGLGLPHLLGAACGLALAARRWGPGALAWLALGLPYLVYEVALGQNSDYGLYVPFVMPAVAVGLGSLVAAVVAPWAARRRRWGYGTAIVLGLVAVAPSLAPYQRAYATHEREAAEHFKPSTLAALALRERLPEDAVVIQSRREWNVNILPYYARRQHVSRHGTRLILFQPGVPETPMNRRSFERLTTERLAALIASGRPVFAFEPRPLVGSDPARLDPGRFRWEPALAVETGPAISELDPSPSLRALLSDDVVRLYRGRLAPGGPSR